MPRWPDLATQSTSPNTSGSITDHMYVVVHTADGSYAGTISWQRDRASGISSHFVVAKDGRITQMLDSTQKGWTQKAGNSYSISIENEGNENTPLTAYQIEANARILARVHQVHGVPLQLTGRVGTRGLGHHSMGYESNVDWGHSQCPGNIIKGQKAAILARAKEIVAGKPLDATAAPTEDEDMGASFGPIEIQAEQFTSLCLPPVGQGAADPRPAWIDICNDLWNATEYALRLWWSKGDGVWTPLIGTDGLVKLASGKSFGKPLPTGLVVLSVLRMAIADDGSIVESTPERSAYQGHLTLCIERGKVG